MKRLFLLAIPLVASAASVTVSWDTSVDPSVTSHQVRYGLSSSSKTNVAVATGTNSVAIVVPDGTRIFLDVTAVNSIGIKSLPSAEVSFSTAAPPAPTNIRVIAQ